MTNGCPVVIALSGLDPTGGAGLLADIRALSAAGVRIAPLLTANTIQGRGIRAEYLITDPAFLRRQLTLVADQFRPSAMKIGMIGCSSLVRVIRDFLDDHAIPVALDPVMQATTGGRLSTGAVRAAVLDMAKRITVLTPNKDELAWLSDTDIRTRDRMNRAVEILTDAGFAAVYVKGGHFAGDPVDVLYRDGHPILEFAGSRFRRRIRGTGCHFAAFLAGKLAWGDTLEDACSQAYDYVQSLFHDFTGGGSGILPADLPLDDGK